ncbi:MAG: TonB-dependent SusC/RagA subfamily outer membrane receptor, partial [Flavobacteriaceae bacterium]
MKKMITGLLFIFCSFGLAAQTLNIKGVVKDINSGETLPGVSVVIKGTTIGTETDFDGLFMLSNVKKGAILVFNYLGMKSKEVVVKSAEMNISLEESAEALDEIVVVGYGTQKKKEVTGAVSVIDSKAIEKLNPTRVEQALQGQIAGVNITSSSGSPGSGSNIRIRGVSTNGDSSPLILVDGNVISDLSVLNPNDIKSINVLKDATAGIYGVRAANGVVLITTKTGRKESDLKFQLDAWTGI